MNGKCPNRDSTVVPMRVRAALGGILMLLAMAVTVSGRTAAQDRDADARLFAGQVLSLRTAGVAGADWLGTMLPGLAGADGEASASILWAPFFENAVIGFEEQHSPTPSVLYYNPLLDVALVTRWRKPQERYGVTHIHALPGERLAGPRAAVSPRPRWLVADEGPIDALADLTAARLAAFRRAPSANTPSAERNKAADRRVVLSRLASNAAMRVRWTEKSESWLEPALGEVRKALASRSAAALRRQAPETDAESAEALSDLPADFVARLGLDMTLEIGGRERLLIGSSPDDGDIYIFVLCRLEGSACALRRIVMASLWEWSQLDTE